MDNERTKEMWELREAEGRAIHAQLECKRVETDIKHKKIVLWLNIAQTILFAAMLYAFVFK